MTQQHDDTAESFRKVLSSHGYEFQYAVLKHISALAERGLAWRFESAEVPVDVGGRETHVDFVLRFGNMYVVAECKRPDPAVAHWCFARTAFSVRNRTSPKVVLEKIKVPAMNDAGSLRCSTYEERVARPPYHVGVELRTDGTGEGIRARGAISEAQNQVLRGASGFVDLAIRERLVGRGQTAIVVPAIFTTARISTTETDLSNADVHSGRLPELTAEDRDWIWYQHNASRSMLASPWSEPAGTDRDLSDLMISKHMRSVAVVTPDAIESSCNTLGI